MRRVLALLVLTLALASPASAQKTPIKVIPPPAPAAPALRGLQSADSPGVAMPAGAVAATAAGVLAQSFIPLRSLPDTPVAGEAGQCRLSCAQSYYFCLAGDGSDDCAPTWGQCRAACDAPGVAGAGGG
ncbi:hypothetical protein BH11PSE1_BH11PSE1_23600 [soil metagenome]